LRPNVARGSSGSVYSVLPKHLNLNRLPPHNFLQTKGFHTLKVSDRDADEWGEASGIQIASNESGGRGI